MVTEVEARSAGCFVEPAQEAGVRSLHLTLAPVRTPAMEEDDHHGDDGQRPEDIARVS